MGERERYEPGTFCWADLGTDDAGAAKAFYIGLFGWETEDLPMGDAGPYTMCSLDGGVVCAIYPRDPGEAPPAWLQYISVVDADAAATAARSAGAVEVQEPFDVFDAGRMAVVQDPAGAHFALWQPRRTIGATLVNVPGAFCLNQLNTSDPAGAAAFYTEVFGWRVEQVGSDPMPYWGIWNRDRLNGGMMTLPPGSPAPPHWLLYFATDDVDRLAGRAGELGARVVAPPMDVPGGRIAVAVDPTGAAFGILQGRLDP